jgi:hypothetical protein
VDCYACSRRFTALEQEAHGLKAALAEIRYALLIRGGRIRVSRYESEPDYSETKAARSADLDRLDIHPSMRLRIDHCLQERSEPYIG